MYESLVRPNLGDDLEVLFDLTENKDKIAKLTNEEPTVNCEGNYSMTFSRPRVIPAIENSVVIDKEGKEILEMVKVDNYLFEVSVSNELPS